MVNCINNDSEPCHNRRQAETEARDKLAVKTNRKTKQKKSCQVSGTWVVASTGRHEESKETKQLRGKFSTFTGLWIITCESSGDACNPWVCAVLPPPLNRMCVLWQITAACLTSSVTAFSQLAATCERRSWDRPGQSLTDRPNTRPT